MFKNVWQNMTKNQRIGAIVLLQLFFLAIVAGVIYWSFQPKENVEVVNENSTPIPSDYWKGVKQEVWNLLEKNVSNLTQSNIDDAVIREGTYSETYNNDIITATFLLDIESLRQTYAITVSWSKKVDVYDAIQINCPPRDQMLYPETICYGMYNNTYSLDLYLPYAVYPEGYDDDDDAGPVAPNYIIHGDEEAKTIDVTVSSCDVEKYKDEAMRYLDSTPIRLSQYQINFEVNDINVECQ